MSNVRRIVFAVVAVVCLGVLLRGCPSIRDGIPGQLAQAQQDCESASRTGVLAVRLWRDDRSTSALAAVQLGDAGEQITTATQDIATLAPDTAVDLERQRTLMATMAEAIAALNAARALVQGLPSPDDGGAVDRDLARVVRDFAVQGPS
jgi:hypothetical protein